MGEARIGNSNQGCVEQTKEIVFGQIQENSGGTLLEDAKSETRIQEWAELRRRIMP